MKKSDKDYYQGFAYALANVQRYSMMPQVVQDVINATGITIETLIEARCEEADIEEIKKALEC
jgi:hypothetical protein